MSFVERGGDLKIHKPDTQTTVTAGHIDVFTGRERTLQTATRYNGRIGERERSGPHLF